jgi:hypothetical protein
VFPAEGRVSTLQRLSLWSHNGWQKVVERKFDYPPLASQRETCLLKQLRTNKKECHTNKKAWRQAIYKYHRFPCYTTSSLMNIGDSSTAPALSNPGCRGKVYWDEGGFHAERLKFFVTSV